jgi:hypothetical protein
MKCEWWIGNYLEYNSCCLILRLYPGTSLEGLTKTTKTSAGITGLRADIWTRDHSKTKQEFSVSELRHLKKTQMFRFSYGTTSHVRLLSFSVFKFLNHTETHVRTPLDEWWARRRSLYLHRTTQEKNIHALSRIRTRDSSNQVGAELRLRPLGHLHMLILHDCFAHFDQKQMYW